MFVCEPLLEYSDWKKQTIKCFLWWSSYALKPLGMNNFHEIFAVCKIYEIFSGNWGRREFWVSPTQRRDLLRCSTTERHVIETLVLLPMVCAFCIRMSAWQCLFTKMIYVSPRSGRWVRTSLGEQNVEKNTTGIANREISSSRGERVNASRPAAEENTEINPTLWLKGRTKGHRADRRCSNSSETTAPARRWRFPQSEIESSSNGALATLQTNKRTLPHSLTIFCSAR